jgi:S-adenosylmethionine:tRNA ribosyltransferase-isomerase
MDAAMGVNPDDFNFRFGRVGKQPLDPLKTRLMVVDRKTGKLEHLMFQDLPDIAKGREVWGNDSLGSHPYFQQQAFYANKPGSYLPPTAGIPVTPDMVSKMDFHVLTLHTHCPSKQEDPWACYSTGRTAEEPYQLYKAPGTAPVALGTTVAKGLESWGLFGDLRASSGIFVSPGWSWRVVGMFLTNFHWPKEPLLAMTCAFGGTELIREAHEVAFREGYAFSDYGDRMLVV